MKNLKILTLLFLSISLTACSSNEGIKIEQAIDFKEMGSQTIIYGAIKEFEPKLESYNNYKSNFNHLKNAEVYINTDSGEHAPLILIETDFDLNDLNDNFISELQIAETLFRSSIYRSTGGRTPRRIYIGYELYDVVLVNKSSETIRYIDGMLLNSTLTFQILTSLTELINEDRLKELMESRIPISEQIKYKNNKKE